MTSSYRTTVTYNTSPIANTGERTPDTIEYQRREEMGLCMKCGNQLYDIKTKKKGLFHSGKKTREIKVPLNIPGQVERGQCLKCCTGSSTACDGDDTVSPRSSNHSSPVEEEELVPLANRDHHGVGGVVHTGKAIYKGAFNVYGERDGSGGVMTWENGDVFTGDFFNGNRHGHGTLVFADGSEYVGEWECNRQHGAGTRRWNNGDCYTGQYVDGARTGEGRFYFANGDLYVGEWVNGIMHGFGRYYYASGQRFEGTFWQGKRLGKGKLQRTDGSLDIGVYQNDVRVGLGVRWSADRTMTWKMCEGLIKKKIPVPEAVALDYDIDAAATHAFENKGTIGRRVV